MDKEAGRKLRQIRQRLGISTTQVAEMSSRLAQAEGNGEFLLSTARLAQIENAGSAPSLHKLYALAIIYRVRFSDLLRLYGLDLSKTPAHLRLFQPAGTVPAQVELLDPSGVVSFPVRFDPGFDRRATQFMNQVVEAWGRSRSLCSNASIPAAGSTATSGSRTAPCILCFGRDLSSSSTTSRPKSPPAAGVTNLTGRFTLSSCVAAIAAPGASSRALPSY